MCTFPLTIIFYSFVLLKEIVSEQVHLMHLLARPQNFFLFSLKYKKISVNFYVTFSLSKTCLFLLMYRTTTLLSSLPSTFTPSIILLVNGINVLCNPIYATVQHHLRFRYTYMFIACFHIIYINNKITRRSKSDNVNIHNYK